MAEGDGGCNTEGVLNFRDLIGVLHQGMDLVVAGLRGDLRAVGDVLGRFTFGPKVASTSGFTVDVVAVAGGKSEEQQFAAVGAGAKARRSGECSRCERCRWFVG